MPYCISGSSIKFQGHMGWKIDDLNPVWVRLLGRSQLSNPSDLPCYYSPITIYKDTLQNSNFGTHCEIAFMLMPQNLINEMSLLAQVMVFNVVRHQAIIWAKFGTGLCHHVASLGHNGLISAIHENLTINFDNAIDFYIDHREFATWWLFKSPYWLWK